MDVSNDKLIKAVNMYLRICDMSREDFLLELKDLAEQETSIKFVELQEE